MALDSRFGGNPAQGEQFAPSIPAALAAAQPDSTAPDVATLKADFNALLAKLRAANLMET